MPSPEDLNREQLEAMDLSALVGLFNRLTGSSVKRFASRAVGVRRTLKALTKRNATPRAPVTSAAKMGRPKKDFALKLNAAGNSKVQEGSLRRKIIEHMKAHGGTCKLSELSEAFGPKARAAVVKLIGVHWLKREGGG